MEDFYYVQSPKQILRRLDGLIRQSGTRAESLKGRSDLTPYVAAADPKVWDLFVRDLIEVRTRYASLFEKKGPP